MRANSLAPLRRPAVGFALASALCAMGAAGPGFAEEIDALDSYFSSGDEVQLQPASLDIAEPAETEAVVPPPLGARPTRGPRPELLLADADADEGTGALSDPALSLLRESPAGTTLNFGPEDPLQPDPAAPQAGDAEPKGDDLLASLFSDASSPLEHALRRRADPIGVGAVLASVGAAALDTAGTDASPAEPAPQPAAPAPHDGAAWMHRRLLLLGVGLFAAVVAIGTLIFSFAPRGGSMMPRR